MKVTVVTATYNAAATIRDTLRSVAAQSHPDIEHIVIDGASSDDTLAIVARESRPGMIVVSEPDRGLYDAMNKGLACASGELIGFLNADDFFCRSDAVERLVAAAKPGVDAVMGAVVIVGESNVDSVRRAYGVRSFRPWMLHFGHMPPHPGFYMTRRARDLVGPFDAAYRIGGDLEWMVRFFLVHRLQAATVAETLVAFRQGGVSTRGLKSLKVINREALRSIRRHARYTNSGLLWARYLVKAAQYAGRPYDFPAPPALRWVP